MRDFTFFTVESQDGVAVVHWKESEISRSSLDRELHTELCSWVADSKPCRVLVSFADLQRCPSALLGGLIGMRKQLAADGGELKLCDVNSFMQEKLRRLNLERMFDIHTDRSDAIIAFEAQPPHR